MLYDYRCNQQLIFRLFLKKEKKIQNKTFITPASPNLHKKALKSSVLLSPPALWWVFLGGRCLSTSSLPDFLPSLVLTGPTYPSSPTASAMLPGLES